MPLQLIEKSPGDLVKLPNRPDGATRVHVLQADQINALNAALATGRALLVQGEPGIGKTQLALAAAIALRRVFIAKTVDAHTESRDLLWHFDAVARLAQAQLTGALFQHSEQSKANRESIEQQLAPQNYIRPGPFWWGFNWASALKQLKETSIKPPRVFDGCARKNGCVILVDEIDKADPALPNGLLEILGDGLFQPEFFEEKISLEGPAPLVVITSNNERALPDPFIRRCVVLELKLPPLLPDSSEQPDPDDTFKQHLVNIGAHHFPDARLPHDVLSEAADLLIRERLTAIKAQQTRLPGQAEYIDLLRACEKLGADKLKQVAPYVVAKRMEAPG